MKKFVLLLLIHVLLASSADVRAQAVPSLMNFQGQVLAADGSPLATGDYALTFQIFDAADGGTLIWGPQALDGAGGAGHGPKIPVVQGYFNVMLGPVDTAGRPLAGAFLGASRFLETIVGTNSPISPRQQVLSAPYALTAANAASAASAAGVVAGAVGTVGLADAAVSTLKLGDGAVTAAKVANGSINATKLAQEIVDQLVPTGTVVAYAGTNTAPNRWIVCDGSIRNGGDPAFSALFAAIGKAYGNGDGTTLSFNLPDLRGRTVLGTGQGAGLSSRTLAAKLGTETEAITQVPAHTHTLSGGIQPSGAHTHNINAWLASGGTRMADTAGGSTASHFTVVTESADTHTHNHNLAVQSTGGAVSVNNVQPSIVLNFIIKL